MKSTSPVIPTLPVHMLAGGRHLRGDLILPERAEGLIIFARIDGKYGDYPQDRKMAAMFAKHRLATLLVDLPSQGKEPDILALADMLHDIVRWTRQDQQTACLPLGCFSTDTGVAVMLSLAAQPDKPLPVVVSCDGELGKVTEGLLELSVPVLFIIGNDPEMKRSTQAALGKIKSQTAFNIIPHASHVFENARALEEASQLAALWFADHMIKVPV